MYDKINDLLCNQSIDVALLVGEFREIVNSGKVCIPEKFINRVNSVLMYVYTLFNEYNAEEIDNDFVQEKMVNLMNTLLSYRSNYREGSYGYRLMNSLFDVVNETYISIENFK